MKFICQSSYCIQYFPIKQKCWQQRRCVITWFCWAEALQIWCLKFRYICKATRDVNPSRLVHVSPKISLVLLQVILLHHSVNCRKSWAYTSSYGVLGGLINKRRGLYPPGLITRIEKSTSEILWNIFSRDWSKYVLHLMVFKVFLEANYRIFTIILSASYNGKQLFKIYHICTS